jgi:hypothetical protein
MYIVLATIILTILFISLSLAALINREKLP